MSSSQPRQQPRQAQQQQAQAQAQAQQQDMMLQELTRMREQLELLQLQVNQNNPVVAPAPAPAPVPPQPTVSLAGKKNVRASATSVISAAPATSSSSGADASATSNAAKLKAQKLDTRIEQAMNEPLYLLRQTGPYGFVVCNDTQFDKFRVLLGPQQCTCNKHHCVHLLFVMLRVLRVETTNPLLRLDVLREFEIDQLVRRAEARFNLNLGHLKGERPTDTEEEACPICLLPLLVDQDLIRCTKGCGNRLHEKCMAVWARERRRLSDKIQCPLCRIDWDVDPTAERQPTSRTNLLAELTEESSSSPSNKTLHGTMSPEQMQLSKSWLAYYEQRTIASLFSKSWEAREAALSQIAKAIREFPESADGMQILEITVAMFKQVVLDAVYKVYNNFLAAFRVLYSEFIPMRLNMSTSHKQIQNVLRPLIDDLMTRCSERAQTRILTRYSDELLNMARDSRFGITFLLPMCLSVYSLSTQPSWRWYLGRLELLLVALSEFPEVLRTPPMGEVEKPLLEFFAACIDHDRDAVRENVTKLLLAGAEIARQSPAGLGMLKSFVSALKPMIKRPLDKRILTVSNRALSQLPQLAATSPEQQQQQLLQQQAPQPSCAERIAEEERADGRIPAAPAPTPATDATAPRVATPQPSQTAPSKSEGAQGSDDSSLDPASTGMDVQSSLDALLPPGLLPLAPSAIIKPTTLVDQLGAVDLADKAKSSHLSLEASSSQKKHQLQSEFQTALLQQQQQQHQQQQQPAAVNGGNVSADASKQMAMLKGFSPNDRWRRGNILGIGASSTCYAVLDLIDGKIMAMKQIAFRRPTGTEDAERKTLSQIERELDVLKSLSHPHILHYYRCEWEENHLNLFLEHAAGGSLASLLHKYGPLPERVASVYTRQMLLGLEYLHNNRFIHRDIKTANILLDGNGVIKIADFGDSARLQQMQTLTNEFRSLKGTPAYMSPEAIRSEKRGRRCDVWSLGCVVLEMLTCRLPWLEYNEHGELNNNNQTMWSVMYRVASMTEAPRLPDFLSDVVVDFLLQCLNLDARQRSHCKDLLKSRFIVQGSSSME